MKKVVNRRATTFWDYSDGYKMLEPCDFVRIHKSDLKALTSAVAVALASLAYSSTIREDVLRRVLTDVLNKVPDDLCWDEGRGDC